MQKDEVNKKICNEIRKYNKMCNNMCSTMIEGCEKCMIAKFEEEYNISGFNCETIFMAIHLLGYNENTAEYIKQQYRNMKTKICSKYKCSTCPVLSLTTAVIIL